MAVEPYREMLEGLDDDDLLALQRELSAQGTVDFEQVMVEQVLEARGYCGFGNAEAARERLYQTGPECWDGGFAENH